MRTDSCHTRKSKKISLTRFGERWELNSKKLQLGLAFPAPYFITDYCRLFCSIVEPDVMSADQQV